MSKGKFGVVLTFDGRLSRPLGRARFAHIGQALKERDRCNQSAWFRVGTPGDLLREGSFRYQYRVWDHSRRDFADRVDGSTVSGVAPCRDTAGNPGFQVRTDQRGTDG